MGTEQFAVFLAVKELGEAIGLTRGDRLANGDEGDLADIVFDAGFLERAFGFADRGDLRVAVGAAGEIGDLARFVAGDIEAFDRLHGFERSGVGEPWRAGDVARGIDAGDRSFIAVADIDISALGEGGLRAAGQHRLDADGDEADIGLDRAFFLRSIDREFDMRAEIFLCGDLGVGEAANALLGERLLERVADFIVLDRQNARCHFDERDLGAEGVVDVGKLDANRACADDDHFLRLLGEGHRFLGSDHRLAIEGQRWKLARFATGGDENVLGFKGFDRSVGALHADFAGALDRAEAADIIDFVFLEEKLDAAGEFVGNFA